MPLFKEQDRNPISGSQYLFALRSLMEEASKTFGEACLVSLPALAAGPYIYALSVGVVWLIEMAMKLISVVNLIRWMSNSQCVLPMCNP
jgi:hypothetical protein